MENDYKKKLNEVYQACLYGEIDAKTASESMRDILQGNLDSVNYHEEGRFTLEARIDNVPQRISLSAKNTPSKKEQKRVLELIGYLMNYANGRSKVHLGKFCGTKDHSANLMNVLGVYN